MREPMLLESQPRYAVWGGRLVDRWLVAPDLSRIFRYAGNGWLSVSGLRGKPLASNEAAPWGRRSRGLLEPRVIARGR